MTVFNQTDRTVLKRRIHLIILLLSLWWFMPVMAQSLTPGSALTGAWFNPETAGQGILIDVDDDQGFLFIAWFTFDDNTGTPADQRQRWLTIQGNSAMAADQLTVFNSRDGRFNDPAPVTTEPVGSASLVFHDCNSATLAYEIDDTPSGSIPLQRLLPADESRCDALRPVQDVPLEIDHSKTIAISGVSIIPMTDEVILTNQTVLIADGIIQALGADDSISIEPGVEQIDGRGRFLMPGIIDAHTHMATNVREAYGIQVPLSNPQIEESASNQLMLYLARGVTTIINDGDFGEPLPFWGSEVAARQRVGPTILAAQYARGGNNTCDLGPPSATVTDAASGRQLVISGQQSGYRYMKVYNCTPRLAVLAILEEARNRNMAVLGHIPNSFSLAEAFRSGLDNLAHSEAFIWSYFGALLDENLIPSATALTLENEVTVTTTLLIVELIAQVWGGNAEGIAEYWAREQNMYMHPSTRALNSRSITSNRFNPPGSSPGDYDNRVAFLRVMISEMQAAGVEFMLGTDSPTVLGVPGFSAHGEIQALARTGLDPLAVLQIATRNGGRFLNRTLPETEPIGQIIEGARADLILLDANPLQDLANTEQILGVMARGHWRSTEWFDEQLALIADSYANTP